MTPVSGLELDLPEGFVVLSTEEPALPDVRDLPEPLASWYDDVAAQRVRAGAALVAVQVEQLDDGLTALSLAVHLLPLEPELPEVAVQGLRALALTRTSTAGEVAVLDLPTGPAVATADVVTREDGRSAAVATLQVPLPELDRLLTLTLSTPAVDRLPACAAIAAAIGLRLRLSPTEVPA